MTAVTLVCPRCGAQNRVPEARLADGPRCGACKAPLFTGEPAAVDETALARHIAHDGVPVLVDVWASWCGPCRAMAPQFAAAAKTLEPRWRLLKLDADQAPQTMSRHAIRGVPTLLVFSNGRLAGQQAGAMSAAQITQWAKAQISQ
ncbi:thioredoxin domain-containing protein [Acidocella sp.]|uniref:thioredoxin domain-containing protein n=1 Tax=Acidocella sp. TaxID=50710 RepID=UPI002622EF50|nr:thioredoxin domain-containing protein [Acidocella sp.]